MASAQIQQIQLIDNTNCNYYKLIRRQQRDQVTDNKMFEYYTNNAQQSVKPKKKIITLMMNGHPQKTLTFQINAKKGVTKEQISKFVQRSWNQLNMPTPNLVSQYQSDSEINSKRDANPYYLSFKNIRIFSIEAVEYFDEDLQYIKNGDRLYISRGEDYDSNRNFGQYQIIRKLGEGGFGSVDLARNIITKEFAAIKIVKPDKNSNSNDIDMIFKQAENLKALNHPNIVKILNCYTLKDMRVVIVMEYLEGGQLLKLLKQQKFGFFQQKQAKIYFKQIISGVSYCHRQGIIHRDLKLENILIKNVQKKPKKDQLDDEDETKNKSEKQFTRILKIADFGISGVADRFNPQVDWGTLRYMSPQVLSGKSKLNSTYVDVWACGVILYLMVTGKFPFDGNSSFQITQNIIKRPLEFPNNILLTIKCKDLIKLLLQKNTSKRINFSDIEDHPWLNNQNLTAMAILQKDRYSQPSSIKTVGSQQHFYHLNTKDFIKMNYDQYDIEDLRRLENEEFIAAKKRLGKSICNKRFKDIKDRRQIRNNKNFIQRKSMNVNMKPIQYDQIKIPKRLEKQKDQIIQELRNYKQHFKQKQKQHKDPKQYKQVISIRDCQKDKKKTIGLVNNNLQQNKEKQKKYLPLINNKRNSKYIQIVVPVNLEKNVQLKKEKQFDYPLNSQIQKNINFNEPQFKVMLP